MANEEVRIANEATARSVLVNCMLKYGITNTTKERVARESHLSLTSIVRYFPTKDSMVEAAAQATGRINREYFKMTLNVSDGKTGIELLREFFKYIADAYIEYPAPYILRAEIINYVYRTVEKSDEAIRTIVQEMGYRDLLKKVLTRGIEDGTISLMWDVQTETDYVGDLLFNFMSGMAHRVDMKNPKQVEEVRTALDRVMNAVIGHLAAK